LRLPQKNPKNYQDMRASEIFWEFCGLAVSFLLLPDRVLSVDGFAHRLAFLRSRSIAPFLVVS
jgi:hypothetical protein